MSLGYVALALMFVGMIAMCFAFAVSELLHPRDPGPLPIDVGRDMQDRYFARLLRRTPAPARNIVAGEASHVRHAAPVELPDGAAVSSGAETFLVHGDGAVLPGSVVDAFICDGVATIGAAARVIEHAEGGRELLLDIASRVGGRATSGERIVLSPDAEVRFAGAPIIRTTGGPAPAPHEPLESWDPQLDADLEWLLSSGAPLDRAVKDLASGSGRNLNAVEGLRRAERSMLASVDPLPLKSAAWAPSWLGVASGWYLGAGTVRVRGDLILPAGAVVPFHLIVEGSLATGRGVVIHGSVHAWGDVALGEGSRVEGSLTGKKSMTIADACYIGGCGSAGSDATIGSGCWIGSERNGGFASAGRVTIGPGTVIVNKLYAEQGARVASLRPALVFAS